MIGTYVSGLICIQNGDAVDVFRVGCGIDTTGGTQSDAVETTDGSLYWYGDHDVNIRLDARNQLIVDM